VKKLIFAGIIVVLALSQATAAYYVHIFNIRPDLILICAVIAALFYRPRWALSLSVFAGLLKDIFSVAPFGMNAVLFFLWSFLIIKLSRVISLDNSYVRLVLIFIVAISDSIASMLILLLSGNFISWGVFFRIAVVGSLYTTLFFPLVLKLAIKSSVIES
jgi:rod shape-determining protein MreD